MAISGQHGGNVLQMAQQFGLRAEHITDFSANINPLGLPATLRHILMQQLNCLQHYPDIEYRRLHQSIASHHHCSPRCVVAGNGATELIFLWVRAIQPRTALLVEPGFAEYRRALTRANCEITNFMLSEQEGFQLTERILGYLQPGLDCLFLCTPNNPTGLMPEQGLLQAIVERCRLYRIALFVDESFLDFMPQTASLTHQLNAFKQLYILRSLTKFYALPGLRLGYLLSADTRLLDHIRDEREPWTINALAALAGEHIFDDSDYRNATYHWLQQEREYLMSQLSQFTRLQVYPPSANYIFFKHLSDHTALQAALMHEGILIRSCANYTGLDTRYSRIAIKDHTDNMELIEALKRVLPHG